MPRISLRTPTVVLGRLVKEVDLNELKLTHRVDQNAVLHLLNDRGAIVMSLSPSLWASIDHATPEQTAQ